MSKLLVLLLFPAAIFSQSFKIEVDQLFQKKEYEKAVYFIKKYVSSNPNNINAIELLGDAYAYQRKWNEAITYYKTLLKTDDFNANYHYKYGGALGMIAQNGSKIKALGLINDIKNSFLRASELDVEHIDARWALVELYMQLPGILGGSTYKSLKYANELENLSKVDGFLAKGYIYEYDNKPELAEYYYKKAIETEGSLTCFETLTNFSKNENKLEKTVINTKQEYSKHNKNALHYQIGKVSADYNIMLDRGERCLKIYIKNYSARDGVPLEWAYFRLSQIYKNRRNKTEALKWIDKALLKRTGFSQAEEEKKKILSLQ